MVAGVAYVAFGPLTAEPLTARTGLQGPGLGLALAAGIIKAHHGEIWVESEGYNEEKCPGSTFFIRLPMPEGT